jgi:hypothetical protein
MRQLAELCRRLSTAEDALADALSAMKRAGEAFDAASDRFNAAERALTRLVTNAPRRARNATQPGRVHERASTNVDWPQRRVRELSDRLGVGRPGTAEQVSTVPGRIGVGRATRGPG